MPIGHRHNHMHGPDNVPAEAPLDAANQSLADALRSSFNILKFVMFVLVIMYCFSGVQCIEENEEAVVLQFGKLLEGVRKPGLSLALPYPIAETLRFPTRRDNSFVCTSHWPKVKKDEEALPLNRVRIGGGLKPGLDGGLLTADRGLVHIQWKPTYRVEDLRSYVLYVADRKDEAIEHLITTLLENAAIQVVSQYGAMEAWSEKTTEIALAVKAEINNRLEQLSSGVVVTRLDVVRSSVPGQTIAAFDEVTSAQNQRDKTIIDARQKRSDVLNDSAGAAYEPLIALLDQCDRAKALGDAAELERVERSVDLLLEESVGGKAGEAIRQAKGYFTKVVQEVQGDVEEHRAALGEYLNTPDLFVHRMWERTRQRVLQYDEVKKHFVSSRANEIRIHIGPDPEQRRLDEQRKLEKEAEKYDFAAPEKIHTILP